MVDALEWLREKLAENIQLLSSFDKYKREVWADLNHCITNRMSRLSKPSTVRNCANQCLPDAAYALGSSLLLSCLGAEAGEPGRSFTFSGPKVVVWAQEHETLVACMLYPYSPDISATMPAALAPLRRAARLCISRIAEIACHSTRLNSAICICDIMHITGAAGLPELDGVAHFGNSLTENSGK